MPSKPIWKSKTFWMNAGVAVAGFVLQHEGLLSHIPQEYQALAIAVANIVVRLNTTQPVSVT